MNSYSLDVKRFGAKGDGQTDDTRGIHRLWTRRSCAWSLDRDRDLAGKQPARARLSPLKTLA